MRENFFWGRSQRSGRWRKCKSGEDYKYYAREEVREIIKKSSKIVSEEEGAV